MTAFLLEVTVISSISLLDVDKGSSLLMLTHFQYKNLKSKAAPRKVKMSKQKITKLLFVADIITHVALVLIYPSLYW